MSVHILHIDTSGSSAAVMIAAGGIPVSHKISETERDHAGKVNYLVADALEAINRSLGQLDAVAVCNGPGSYTGLRIGLATAKGYCYALNKPLILHNRLNLMLRELDALIADEHANKLAILPARSGEYYVAASGELNADPQHITTEALLQLAAGLNYPFAVVGEKAEDLSSLQTMHEAPHSFLDMSAWADATYEAFVKGEFADLAYAVPDYLKSAFITTSRTDR